MSTQLRLEIERLPSASDLPLPAYATPGSAGLDLCAAVSEPITLTSLGRAAIPTGFKVQIPWGWEGQVRPRSGLALRHGLSMPNAPGTIDSDYRGELMVVLINLGAEPVTIVRGMRIAQLVICPVGRAELVEVSSLAVDTQRGTGGFGSTGA